MTAFETAQPDFIAYQNQKGTEEKMKVSVIIPVYNGEKTIKNSIKSVLNQTMTDIEVIVVNDGSTDGTLEILNDFDDKRLRVITQENAGQGAARNTGMAAATGEYIGFVDADDTIEPVMYEKMYEKAVEYDVEVVQCNIMRIDFNGEKSVFLKMNDEFVEIRDRARYMAHYVVRTIHSYEMCNKIFKRSFLEENNLKVPDTHKCFSEDIFFNMAVAQCLKRIYFVDETYYNYYEYETSHMHKGNTDRLEKMQTAFDEFLIGTSGVFYNATAFLAAMVTLYNIALCGEKSASEEAAKNIGKYIRPALKSRCGLKRRLYLTAILLFPVPLRVWMSGFLDKN